MLYIRRVKYHFLIIGGFFLALTGCSNTPQKSNQQDTVCTNQGTSLVVKLKAHRLYLCDSDGIESEFRIAIGQNGYPKTKEGDKKTPIGIYALKESRPSEEFGTFIPVDYPNPEDKLKGRTGRDIGIHGPKRASAFLGFLNTTIDWTLGCIAVSSDKNISLIANWIEKERISTVKIIE